MATIIQLNPDFQVVNETFYKVGAPTVSTCHRNSFAQAPPAVGLLTLFPIVMARYRWPRS